MKAITLIELILSIVIFAVIIIPLFSVFSTISYDSAQAIFLNRANIIGQSVLELITSKYFEDPDGNPQWGAESGETTIDKFDDVDDFDGYQQNSISGFPQFSYRVDVYYVNPDENWNQEVDGPTNYKRIDVYVTHPQMGQLILSTAVSRAGHGS